MVYHDRGHVKTLVELRAGVVEEHALIPWNSGA
jgi:hypothetical protein